MLRVARDRVVFGVYLEGVRVGPEIRTLCKPKENGNWQSRAIHLTVEVRHHCLV